MIYLPNSSMSSFPTVSIWIHTGCESTATIVSISLDRLRRPPQARKTVVPGVWSGETDRRRDGSMGIHQPSRQDSTRSSAPELFHECNASRFDAYSSFDRWRPRHRRHSQITGDRWKFPCPKLSRTRAGQRLRIDAERFAFRSHNQVRAFAVHGIPHAKGSTRFGSPRPSGLFAR